jgi:peptidoglycan hydrolase-like protein with peptidoglycan-binding domain
MTDDLDPQDALIAALRTRAADPARRTGTTSGRRFGLFPRRPAGDLRPTTTEAIRAAERELGLSLPPLLVRLYTEVADGGFGPGGGLLDLGRLVRETRTLRSGELLPRNRAWPPALLPLVRLEPGWTCMDAFTSRMVDWDPEDLEERSSQARFDRSFEERSPSLEAWLSKWVTSKTNADRNKPSEKERWARMAARAQTPEGQARQHRKTQAFIASLTPAERERYGLKLDEEPAPEPEGTPRTWAEADGSKPRS